MADKIILENKIFYIYKEAGKIMAKLPVIQNPTQEQITDLFGKDKIHELKVIILQNKDTYFCRDYTLTFDEIMNNLFLQDILAGFVCNKDSIRLTGQWLEKAYTTEDKKLLLYNPMLTDIYGKKYKIIGL